MSKVIVTQMENGICVDVQQFKVDMTALEVKNYLVNHEQNIANIKMNRFKKSGDTA